MEYLATLLLLSFISSLVGFGFYIMLDEDMIFYWYKKILDYLASNKFKIIKYRVFEFKLWYNISIMTKIHFIKLPYFNLGNSIYFRCSKDISHKQCKFLYYITKPLGRCVICSTTWIGIIITLIIVNQLSWLQLFDCIIVGVSSATLVCLISNYYHKIQNEL